MRKVNVGFVVPKLDRGGPEVWLETLLKHIPRDVADPRVVTVAPGGNLNSQVGLDIGHHCPVLQWRTQAQEASILLDHCDVVVTWGPSFADFRRPTCNSFKNPRRVVFVAHGLAPLDGIPGKEAFASHFAAVCCPAVDFFLPSNRELVTVIENGVDFERVTPRLGRGAARKKFGITDPSHRVIGWAGRMSPEKNPLFLARMADPKVNRQPDLRFLFAGDGVLRGDVAAMLAGYQNPENRCVGHVERIGDFLEAVDALAITSHTEACPLILLEAFAAGRRVLSTDFPFLNDLEEDYEICLHDRIDPAAPDADFVEDLASVKHNSGLRAYTQAYAWDRFSASRFAHQWAAYLNAVGNLAP